MIATLEINGHTSSEWAGINFDNTYLKNEKLSMNRSFATLQYIFKNQDDSTKIFLAKVIKGSGLNFSKKRLTFYEKEDKEKSRRVSFKIILK
jgi:outer membrane protein OmpA-like peptidoglycan-associated protein